MRHVIMLTAVLLLAACHPAAGASSPAPEPSRPRSEQAGSPWIVFVAQNPWRMVVGSDSPTFALYGDGQAIFLTPSGYKSVKLTPTEVTALVARLKLVDLPQPSASYEASSLTDQPTNVLMIFGPGKPVVLSVYGRLKSAEVRGQLPPSLVSTYDALLAFDHPAARPWMPETIEVMIWPYDYAPDASIPWPKDWPGLDHPSTVKRAEGAYSLFLPSARYPELKALLAERKEKGAVEIGGKKWAVSTRLPFPGERLWMGSGR